MDESTFNLSLRTCCRQDRYTINPSCVGAISGASNYLKGSTSLKRPTPFHECTISSPPNWSTSVVQSRSGEVLSQGRCEVHQAVHTDQLERGDQHPLMNTSMSCYASKSWSWWDRGWFRWPVAAVLTRRCATDSDVDHLGTITGTAIANSRACLRTLSLCFNILCCWLFIERSSFATLAHFHPGVLVKSKVLQHRKHSSLPSSASSCSTWASSIR